MGTEHDGISRRAWLQRAVGVGAGLLSLQAVGACTASEPAPDPTSGGKPQFDEAALALLDPLRPGSVIEAPWRFETMLRCRDRHLRLVLRDAVHSGTLEIELFRGPGHDVKSARSRPLARTRRWELYSYDGGKGDKQSPDHVRDVIGLVALRIGEVEDRQDLVRLADSACTFDERDQRPRAQ
jgi:hypothetical protein